MSMFLTVFTCPAGHKRAIFRQTRSQGKTVSTYCTTCEKMYPAVVPHSTQPAAPESERKG